MPRPLQITIFWQGPQRRVLIGITHTKNHSPDPDRIEIRALDPKGAPLPIAPSGRRTDFISWKELNKAGGAARYVESLILAAAKSPAWQRHVRRLKEPDLFDHADAHRAPSSAQSRTAASAASARAYRPLRPQPWRRPRPPGRAPR